MDGPVVSIPGHLASRMHAVHGEAGRAWVDDAPRRITGLAHQWGFELHEPYPNLSYAFVAPVTLHDGGEAVLKAQPPHLESRSEIAALTAWDGQGAVRLLRADAAAGCALLERLRPGTPLASASDGDRAIHMAASTMPALWRQPPDDAAIITARRWGRGFDEYLQRFPGGDGSIPVALVHGAAATWRYLDATTVEPRLLHGDLHHDNILAATRIPWLAIDPKGVAGDPALEPAMLLLNPRPVVREVDDLQPFFARRIEGVVAETGLVRDRVTGWAFAMAVLSVAWDAGGAGDVSSLAEGVRQARALQSLLPSTLRSLSAP